MAQQEGRNQFQVNRLDCRPNMPIAIIEAEFPVLERGRGYSHCAGMQLAQASLPGEVHTAQKISKSRVCAHWVELWHDGDPR